MKKRSLAILCVMASLLLLSACATTPGTAGEKVAVLTVPACTA